MKNPSLLGSGGDAALPLGLVSDGYHNTKYNNNDRKLLHNVYFLLFLAKPFSVFNTGGAIFVFSVSCWCFFAVIWRGRLFLGKFDTRLLHFMGLSLLGVGFGVVNRWGNEGPLTRIFVKDGYNSFHSCTTSKSDDRRRCHSSSDLAAAYILIGSGSDSVTAPGVGRDYNDIYAGWVFETCLQNPKFSLIRSFS